MEDNEQSCIPCQICEIKESVYRCPACFTKTCSLLCCNAHKEKYDCTGKRNRSAFVSLNKFTHSTIASDFHFLEDALARSDRGKRLTKELGFNKQRDPRNKRQRIGCQESSTDIPLHPLSQLQLATDRSEPQTVLNIAHGKGNDDTNDKAHVQICDGQEHNESKQGMSGNSNNGILMQYPKSKQSLVHKAKERNIFLLLMPPGMQRHIMNKTTRFDPKTNTLHWKVEIVFHIIKKNPREKCEMKDIKATLTLNSIAENDSIHQHLSREFENQILHSAPSETRSILIYFRESTSYELKSDIATIMKKIPSKSSEPIYNRVDLKQNLCEMLSGMTIIEFPRIEIALKESQQYFPLMIDEL